MSDPGKCPHCKGPMKPLFTGFFCPKDCDKPEIQAKRKSDVDAFNAKVDQLLAGVPSAKPRNSAGFNWVWPLTTPNYTPPMADDQCRDFYCSGKGKITHIHHKNLGTSASVQETHYQCHTCSKTWHIDDPNWVTNAAAKAAQIPASGNGGVVGGIPAVNYQQRAKVIPGVKNAYGPI